MKRLLGLSALMIICLSCQYSGENELPILGETSIDEETGEIIYYQAPAFLFTNQQNRTVSEKDINGKIYVVDFFFSSCPSICPKMTTHLKLVQDHYGNEKRVGIISYSIDPEHDTPERLATYAKNYDINASQWSLLTGGETDVFELAKDYKVRAFDDSIDDIPNLIHDGTFVLVDDKRRIRGYYNGLQKSEIDRLIDDMGLLLKFIP